METGNQAFKRVAVREVDGEFFGVIEKDFGFGAGLSSVKITKCYKTENGASKSVEKWIESRPNGFSTYNKMASSHWSK